MGIEEAYVSIIKLFMTKPTSNIIFNGEKLKALLLKSGTVQGCPLSPIQHSSFYFFLLTYRWFTVLLLLYSLFNMALKVLATAII